MIFISYRRSDSESVVGRIYSELRKHFCAGDIFLDHYSLPAGKPFGRLINERIVASRVALVLIGPTWCTGESSDGKTLQDETDFVRAEVEAALAAPNVDVIPVWVMRAQTGATEVLSLPSSIQPLFQNCGLTIRPIPDEELDIQRMITTLKKMLGVRTDSLPTVGKTGPKKVGYLPYASQETFLGRQEALRTLHDGWEASGTNIVAVSGWAGTGKTSLVQRWLSMLAAAKWDGVDLIVYENFEATSGDVFVERCLDELLGLRPNDLSLKQQGICIAQACCDQKALIWLDGFEWIQDPDGESWIESVPIRALVQELAIINSGLCVITSRREVPELSAWPDTTVQINLSRLSTGDGVTMLSNLGVIGAIDDLKSATEELGGHPLSIHLMATMLRDYWNGDISKRREVSLATESTNPAHNTHAIMRYYEQSLFVKHPLSNSILRLLSMFLRRVNSQHLFELHQQSAIRHPSVEKADITHREWNREISRLKSIGLVLEGAGSRGAPVHLDLHPLVREFFRALVKKETPTVYQDVQQLLSRHFEASCHEQLPDRTLTMRPLYYATVHGCEAGDHQHVFYNIYLPRIKRGEDAFNTRALAAFNADLSVLRRFFKTPWDEFSAEFPTEMQARLSYEVGFNLRATGDLHDAVPPLRHAIEAFVVAENWLRAASSAGDLGLLLLTKGEIVSALLPSQHAVRYADKSNALEERIRQRSNLANVLLHAGEESAVEVYEEALAIVMDDSSSVLLQSFWFYELLFDSQQFSRLERLLSAAKEGGVFSHTGTPHLDAGFRHISQCRLKLHTALQAKEPQGRAELLNLAEKEISKSVQKIRLSKALHHLPRALLTASAVFRSQYRFDEARIALTEAHEIADSGGMRVHLVDIDLELAELALESGGMLIAFEHLENARHVAHTIGYGRRNKQIESIESRLNDREIDSSTEQDDWI